MIITINSTLAILLLDQVDDDDDEEEEEEEEDGDINKMITAIISVAASFLSDSLLCDWVQARQRTWMDDWW